MCSFVYPVSRLLPIGVRPLAKSPPRASSAAFYLTYAIFVPTWVVAPIYSQPSLLIYHLFKCIVLLSISGILKIQSQVKFITSLQCWLASSSAPWQPSASSFSFIAVTLICFKPTFFIPVLICVWALCFRTSVSALSPFKQSEFQQ